MKTSSTKKLTILFTASFVVLFLISTLKAQDQWLLRVNAGLLVQGIYAGEKLDHNVKNSFLHRLSGQVEVEKKLNKNWVLGFQTGYHTIKVEPYYVRTSDNLSIYDSELALDQFILGLQLGAVMNKRTTFYFQSGLCFIFPIYTEGYAVNRDEGKVVSLDGKRLNTRITGYIGGRAQHSIPVNQEMDVLLAVSPRYIFKENIFKNDLLFEGLEFHFQLGCQFRIK